MPALSSREIKDTYPGLMQIPGGVSSDEKALEDGLGNPLPIVITDASVRFLGTVGPYPFKFTHNQAIASSVWTINHNLGFYPSVCILDSAGDLVMGNIRYLSANSIVVTFSLPFGGVAHLN